MQWRRATVFFGTVLAVAPLTCPAEAGDKHAAKRSASPAHRAFIRGARPGERFVTTGRKGHVIDLVGDEDSGWGFYPLPVRYRIGAARYHARPRPYWQNPVLFAIAADAARYDYLVPGADDYRYGVFNPFDGVGSPFFGGYYGP
ncbi:MAG TPA: hypothetical protein VEK34_07335 [Methylocella sp.]|nr:hypothetical protein [Methylocella sp.]